LLELWKGLSKIYWDSVTESGTTVKHNRCRDKCPGVIQHASGAGTVKL